MPRLVYALNKDEKLVNVKDVANGDACGCICPECKKPLCAKNEGKIYKPYFAHKNNDNTKCGYETALHLLAKEIIAEEKRLTLPAVEGTNSDIIRFAEVNVEKWDDSLSIRPDLDCITEDGRRILVEIYNTHPVDPNKRQIIVDNNLLCIEIDVRKQPMNKDSLRRFLTECSDNRYWITKENPNPFRRVIKEEPPTTKQLVIEHIKEFFNNDDLKFQYHRTLKCECVESCKLARQCERPYIESKLVRSDFHYDTLMEISEYTDKTGRKLSADLLLTSKERKPIIISIGEQWVYGETIGTEEAYSIDINIKNTDLVNKFLTSGTIPLTKNLSYYSGIIDSNIPIKPNSGKPGELNIKRPCLIKLADGTVSFTKTNCTEKDVLSENAVYKLTFLPIEGADLQDAYVQAFKIANQHGMELDSKYTPLELNSYYKRESHIEAYHEVSATK